MVSPGLLLLGKQVHRGGRSPPNPAAGEGRAREPAARSEKMAVLFSHVLGCEHIVFAAKKQKAWPAQPGRP